jgi:AAA15 family ATPase/GTPase
MLHKSHLSKNGAQLWMTTHDTSLLDPELLRRDQIWFVEKKKDQTSELYSLLEFSPRKNDAIERGYLQGRYGAVPFLSEFLF